MTEQELAAIRRALGQGVRAFRHDEVGLLVAALDAAHGWLYRVLQDHEAVALGQEAERARVVALARHVRSAAVLTWGGSHGEGPAVLALDALLRELGPAPDPLPPDAARLEAARLREALVEVQRLLDEPLESADDVQAVLAAVAGQGGRMAGVISRALGEPP